MAETPVAKPENHAQSPCRRPCSRCSAAAATTLDELRSKVGEIKSRTRRRHRAPARGQAVRDVRLRGGRPALAVRGRRCRRVQLAERASGPTRTGRASSSSSSRSTRCAWSARVKLRAELYGLVQTKDGLVHRVLPGNHMGQSRWPDYGHRGRQDLAHRDRSRRHGRLHRAPRRTRAERMICKEIRE